jgi:hypothetical protein
MQLPDILFAGGMVLAATSALIFVISNVDAIRGGSRHTVAVVLQVIGLVAILLAWIAVRGFNPGS